MRPCDQEAGWDARRMQCKRRAKALDLLDRDDDCGLFSTCARWDTPRLGSWTPEAMQRTSTTYLLALHGL